MLCVVLCPATRTGSVGSVCKICGMDDVARVDRRLTALLFYDFLLSFILTGCDGCFESDSKYLTCWRKEAYRKT